MRYAIISDIHGNLEALNAVLAHIKSRSIKRIICLGDVVGYGPNPEECLDIVRTTVDVCLKGNHDEAVIEGAYLFNQRAKASIDWTKEKLIEVSQNKDIHEKYLSNLPLSYTEDTYLFIHASPLDPTSDYIFGSQTISNPSKCRQIFDAFDTVMFVGHTHVPCIITEDLNTYSLKESNYKYHYTNQKIIINVGSVGQPRDLDTRASYLEVIDDMFFFHRIPYNIEETKQKILENKFLDDYLGERLLLGK